MAVPMPSATQIMDLVKKGLTLEAQEQVILLREAAVELREQNLELKNQIRNLEERLRIKGTLRFDGSVYWQKEDDSQDGPFCPQCWDVDEKLVRLQNQKEAGWFCIQHKAYFDQ